MLTLTTLASGSSGNCLLLSAGETRLLVDAGISCRRICRSLRDLGVEPSALSGVLVTHEHTDHIAGLATLTKQFRLPVYASPGTGRQLCYRIAALEDLLHTCAPGDAFTVGGLAVETFPTLHEAVLAGVARADLLVVESNHDVDWVKSGPYPYPLKQRILGDHGHLSNEAGAALACTAVRAGARTVILAHLSAENNTPARARDAVALALSAMGADPDRDLRLSVAPRAEPGLCCTA